jgi:mono/diheme cytochrome c family protein
MRSARLWILLAAVIVLLPALRVQAAEESGKAEEEAAPIMRPVRWEEVEDADGEVLFTHLCAACHGLEARGDGPVAEGLGTEFPDLTLLAQRNDGKFPIHRVEDVIRGTGIKAHGTTRMPVWGPSLMAVRDDWPEKQRQVFVANRLHKLAEYLESIQAGVD